MPVGNECDICATREKTFTVAQWLEIMKLPLTVVDLTGPESAEIDYALWQADEDIANYVGWWPAPTPICEEIPVAVRYGTCIFTRAGASRWVTLRYGKVNSIDQVEFLRRSGSCYEVSMGALCLTDAEYGSVELNIQSQAVCRVAQDVERIRIRYTSGWCASPRDPFAFLLCRYAATYLCSSILHGYDLRCEGWQSYTLTDTEDENTTELTHEFTTHIDYEDNGVSIDELVTDETDTTVTTMRGLVKTRQERLPQNPLDRASPFGMLPAQLALWRYLRTRRRIRAYRL